jgi:hypothetical protein
VKEGEGEHASCAPEKNKGLNLLYFLVVCQSKRNSNL